MDDFQPADETAFVVDDVSTIIKEAVENTIGGNAYQHNKVNQWTSMVVEQCLNQLTKLAKPFKYIVTCVIMQKNGAGLHTASSCFWDNSVDGKKKQSRVLAIGRVGTLLQLIAHREAALSDGRTRPCTVLLASLALVSRPSFSYYCILSGEHFKILFYLHYMLIFLSITN
ncbi:dynein light chain Tctex-type 1 isoform X2 [Heterodontus francisci]|uniref:dynein light chain Tctex-type 1 isoform X2 n=1 Tax=Heterodontus francisci TaxID=7792 RepID=UPI00355C00C6